MTKRSSILAQVLIPYSLSRRSTQMVLLVSLRDWFLYTLELIGMLDFGTPDSLSQGVRIRRVIALFGCVIAAVATQTANAQRVQISFDDFENVTLVPFDLANTSIGDGTDWTNVIPGWTIENVVGDETTQGHVATDADAYNGWTALDVDSWIEEQGVQEGRDRMQLGPNNTALVADPDAWDDFPPPGKGEQDYNSFISTTYDISEADKGSLELSFDWDFVAEDFQVAVVDVSFDGGETFQNLITVASEDWENDPELGPFAVARNQVVTTLPAGADGEIVGQGVFSAGDDFTVPEDAVVMLVRFGCVLSGNDWWFAVDNVGLSDAAGVIAFEDFESLDLLPFPDGGVGVPPGDGTDWGDDIPDWTIDNSGMVRPSLEGAFNGWRALDVQSWVNEQGGQERSFLNTPEIFGERNTAMVADPDAHDDYDDEDVNPDDDSKEFNSFFVREYDMTGFANTTLQISLDWEFRIESEQRGLIEVSFDGGNSWTLVLDIDSDNQPSLDALSEFLLVDTPDGDDNFGTVETNDVLATFNDVQTFTFGAFGSDLPATNSNSMILRVGLIDSQNNWWFAVDNIEVSAETQGFVMGDANDDGLVNIFDLDPFINALFGTNVPFDPALDFNADGLVSVFDINGFIFELFQ